MNLFLLNKIPTIGALVIIIVFIYFYNSLNSPPTTISKPYLLILNENEEYLENNYNLTSYFDSIRIDKNVTRNRLLNLTFRYMLNNENICKNNSIQVIFIVTSYFGNVETRSAMRRAFNNNELKNLGFQRVFLLGQAFNDKYTTQNAVVNEHKRFGDVIQGNFEEAYRNLTYKHVMGLKWVSEYCSNAQYVVKMDDDIVVNIRKFKSILNSVKFYVKNFFAGFVMRNMLPIREHVNKWYVTFKEYKYSSYPMFVSGWFYITTPETAKKLVLLSNYVEYFWIDDVYVTGILAKILKIRQHDLSKYYTTFPELLECCINDVKKNLDCDILIGPNGGDNNLFYKFNKAMSVCEISTCNGTRIKPLNETCVARKKVNLSRGEAKISNYKLH